MSMRIIPVLMAAATLVAATAVSTAQQKGEAQSAKKSGGPAVPAASTPPPEGAPTQPRGPIGTPIDNRDYVIGPEDMLNIIVWGEPRLSGPALVRPDGKISMALIDEVEAGGKTPSELQAEITERLKAGDYIKSPLVTVKVEQINSKKYYLQGEVKAPGAYPLIIPTTVLEALVKAGGFQDFANKKKIRVLRMENGKMIEFQFNYNDVTRGKKIEENILLKPGDHIIVP